VNPFSDSPYESLLEIARTAFQRERTSGAVLLGVLAEVDARKDYLAAGYPSMYAWCVGELGLRHHPAYMRIEVARIARRFPAVFPMISEGTLCMTAVNQLGPYLTDENAGPLLSAAAEKSKTEIDQLLQELRQPDLLVLTSRANAADELVPDRVNFSDTKQEPTVATPADRRAPLAEDEPVVALAPLVPTAHPLAPSRIASTPDRMTIHLSMRVATHRKLHRVRELLGHAIASGDMERVLEWMADLSIRYLEKRKHDPPRAARPANPDSRHIPEAMREAVWERDGGRCTFTSESGHRCECRTHLEFDHIIPFARGGETSVENLQLRCRAHNQFDAERTYGATFIARKREAAREDAEERTTHSRMPC
jgi:5-methylcytosine-specific restriction endonuclease McrA